MLFWGPKRSVWMFAAASGVSFILEISGIARVFSGLSGFRPLGFSGLALLGGSEDLVSRVISYT